MNGEAVRPRHLLLLGGGHAHVQVLRALLPRLDARRARVTLVAREPLAPYSGMLPGVVSGAYAPRQAQIDLAALAARAGGGGDGSVCRVVRGEAAAVDVPGRRVLVVAAGADGGGGRGAPEQWVPYDLLSINVGIEPSGVVPGEGGVTPVKPIGGFLERWERDVLPRARRALEERARDEASRRRRRRRQEEEEEEEEEEDGDATTRRRREEESPPPFRVAVVGGGAAGAELAFAVAHRLGGREWGQAWRRGWRSSSSSLSSSSSPSSSPPPPPPPVAPVLVTVYSRGRILSKAPAAARAALLRLASPDTPGPAGLVRIRELRGGGVVGVGPPGGLLRLARAEPGAPEFEPFDACLWCTQASAPSWFARPPSRGLPLDARGFLRTRPTLQLSLAGGAEEEEEEEEEDEAASALDDVFAAGDAAAIDGHPRPKSGVHAVRAGPVLAENLRRRAEWLADVAAAGAAASPPPPPPRLLEHLPWKHVLALVSAGPDLAVAVQPPIPFCPSGAWVWKLKDQIDRAWVRKYDPVAAAARVASDQGDDDDDDA
jgi:selenide,water dikinase